MFRKIYDYYGKLGYTETEVSRASSWAIRVNQTSHLKKIFSRLQTPAVVPVELLVGLRLKEEVGEKRELYKIKRDWGYE